MIFAIVGIKQLIEDEERMMLLLLVNIISISFISFGISITGWDVFAAARKEGLRTFVKKGGWRYSVFLYKVVPTCPMPFTGLSYSRSSCVAQAYQLSYEKERSVRLNLLLNKRKESNRSDLVDFDAAVHRRFQTEWLCIGSADEVVDERPSPPPVEEHTVQVHSEYTVHAHASILLYLYCIVLDPFLKSADDENNCDHGESTRVTYHLKRDLEKEKAASQLHDLDEGVQVPVVFEVSDGKQIEFSSQGVIKNGKATLTASDESTAGHDTHPNQVVVEVGWRLVKLGGLAVQTPLDKCANDDKKPTHRLGKFHKSQVGSTCAKH